MELCGEQMTPDGQVTKMTSEAKAEILKQVDEYSSKA